MNDFRYKNRVWLNQQYIDLENSMEKIGDICGVCSGTIHYWIHKHNIKARTHSKALSIPWNKGPIYTYICKNCGKEFKRSGSHKYLYCSKECSNEGKRGSVPWNKGSVHIYICKSCGKEFERRKSHEYQYCSMKCKVEDQKGITWITYICEYCGKEFKRKKNKSWKIIRFCSNKCHAKSRIGELSPSWKDGKSLEDYGLDFTDKLKSKIRARDNHTCQECNYTEDQLGYTLCVHHIDYDKSNNDPSNLISLCRSCHAKTNFNRDDWIVHYKTIMADIKIVSGQYKTIIGEEDDAE